MSNSTQGLQNESSTADKGLKPGAQKPSIVLVDDDETILRSLRVALSSKYSVTCFSDPVQAVEALESMAPHAVVLDIIMPEHDGFWVYRAIRKFNPTVPIIFNSAYQTQLEIKDVEQILKPFAYLPKNGKLGDMLSILALAVLSHNPSLK